MTTKIGVLGCQGRVGRLLVNEFQSAQHPQFDFVGGTSRNAAELNVPYFVTANDEELFSKADILIDFTVPTATMKHLEIAKKFGKALVIGTTGLNDEQKIAVKNAGDEIPVLISANMSVGVNVLLGSVEEAAARLGPEYHIEIIEKHHTKKLDAPSGTALALGAAAQAGRARNNIFEDFLDFDRNGLRPENGIGFAVVRGGDIVGSHDVGFYGKGEQIIFTHTATDRVIFALGAIRAADWLSKQNKGLYSMKHVLNL
jgi:4-hydroxy-tetrahydrodipicolinate reductase